MTYQDALEQTVSELSAEVRALRNELAYSRQENRELLAKTEKPTPPPLRWEHIGRPPKLARFVVWAYAAAAAILCVYGEYYLALVFVFGALVLRK